MSSAKAQGWDTELTFNNPGVKNTSLGSESLRERRKFRELLRKIAIAEGRPPPPDSEGEEAEGEEAENGSTTANAAPAKKTKQRPSKRKAVSSSKKGKSTDVEPRKKRKKKKKSNKRPGIDRRNMAGETQIMRAVLDEDADKVRELIAANADVTIGDNAGWTPLHECADPEISTLLLLAQADPNCKGPVGKGDTGNTALHEAARHGNADIVAVLLKHHANPAITNTENKRAIDVTDDSSIRSVLEEHIYIKPPPRTAAPPSSSSESSSDSDDETIDVRPKKPVVKKKTKAKAASASKTSQKRKSTTAAPKAKENPGNQSGKFLTPAFIEDSDLEDDVESEDDELSDDFADDADVDTAPAPVAATPQKKPTSKTAVVSNSESSDAEEEEEEDDDDDAVDVVPVKSKAKSKPKTPSGAKRNPAQSKITKNSPKNNSKGKSNSKSKSQSKSTNKSTNQSKSTSESKSQGSARADKGSGRSVSHSVRGDATVSPKKESPRDVPASKTSKSDGNGKSSSHVQEKKDVNIASESTKSTDRPGAMSTADDKAPPRITVEPPINQTVYSGSMVVLYVDAEGAKPQQFQWKQGGKTLVDSSADETVNKIKGASTNTLIVQGLLCDRLRKQVSGSRFGCTITNNFGAANSKPVTITVKESPQEVAADLRKDYSMAHELASHLGLRAPPELKLPKVTSSATDRDFVPIQAAREKLNQWTRTHADEIKKRTEQSAKRDTGSAGGGVHAATEPTRRRKRFDDDGHQRMSGSAPSRAPAQHSTTPHQHIPPPPPPPPQPSMDEPPPLPTTAPPPRPPPPPPLPHGAPPISPRSSHNSGNTHYGGTASAPPPQTVQQGQQQGYGAYAAAVPTPMPQQHQGYGTYAQQPAAHHTGYQHHTHPQGYGGYGHHPQQHQHHHHHHHQRQHQYPPYQAHNEYRPPHAGAGHPPAPRPPEAGGGGSGRVKI